jgi:hypothetical protein
VGALVAWTLIALIAPVLASGDALPEVVFAVAIGAVAIYIPERWWRPSGLRLTQMCWIAALIGVAGGLIRVPSLVTGYETTPASAAWMAIAQLVLALCVLLSAPPIRRRFSALWAVAAGAVTVIGAAMIVGVPDPEIDVFYFLNEGARGLLHGINPYAATFTGLPPNNPGYRDPAFHFDVYSYLPGLLLLSLPTVLVSDVRWLLLGAIPFAAFCLRGLVRQAGATAAVADLLAVAFVSYPGLPWVIRQAWPEPLIVAAFFGGLWALIAERTNWALIGVTAFLSIKQYTPILLLPFWAAGLGLRRVALASLVVLAVSLPFIVWSPTDFWWDAIWYQFQAPQRIDAVSFNGYLLARHGTSLPGWLIVAPPLAAVFYAAWRASRGADWRVVLRLTAGAYCVLFLFNKFAFANYYFLLQAMLLACGGVTLVRPPRELEPSLNERRQP